MIANGKFGNDVGKGKSTCLSGPTTSVVYYALFNMQFVSESINMGALDLVASDYKAIKPKVKLGQCQDIDPWVRKFLQCGA